jgi:predicted DCC family thiol-disulfide oxidoreductase YuxK
MVYGAASSEPAHSTTARAASASTPSNGSSPDPAGRIHFAPLQGTTAASLRGRHPELPTDLDSVLYVDRSSGTERVFVRSEAIFRLAERLARPPAWLAWAAWLPRRLTDLGYRVFARNRHRLAGALACPILPDAARARFLP